MRRTTVVEKNNFEKETSVEQKMKVFVHYFGFNVYMVNRGRPHFIYRQLVPLAGSRRNSNMPCQIL